ncbi:MAG: hypothetical protein ACP5OU_02400 [Methanothrix sp.]
MAGAEEAIIQDANEIALREFEEGLKKSIGQCNSGEVKSFKTKEEFLDHLRRL